MKQQNVFPFVAQALIWKDTVVNQIYYFLNGVTWQN